MATMDFKDILTPHFCTITIIILAVYAVILYRITGKNRDSDKLFGAFLGIALLGIIYHMFLFCCVTCHAFPQFNSWISRLLFSTQYSLEMFIANTIIFKSEVISTMKLNPLLFYIYVPIYGMAVLTSGFAIFHFLSRRLHNWFWLTCNKQAPQSRAHIFIGINSASKILAEDIYKTIKDNSEDIIFIDLPDHKDNPQGISIWDIIARFFKDSDEAENLNKHTILKAGKNLAKLVPWLKNPNNVIYILSDDQNTNISILESLWEHNSSFKCKIFCHAQKDGLFNRYDSLTDVEDRISFIDSSFLAVESLKKSEGENKLLPVHYVDIAIDPSTETGLGYVESCFNCAVLGCGETGREAIKFLYEFGAFPDKNNNKAPFKCHIFDCDIETALGELPVDLETLSSTNSTSEFELHNCKAGTNAFRNQMLELVSSLNYIIICLGNDELNLKIALDIAEYATIQNRSTSKNFCIAFRQDHISKLNNDTLQKANATYNNCLHAFGMSENIWKKNVISNESMEKDARKFFDSYANLCKELISKLGWDAPDWDQRDKDSRDSNYGKRCKARRQIAQDFSNCLHVTTKRILCKGADINADMILPLNEKSTHCTGQNKELLEHLAVCEHLRWEASHIMLGYRPTEGETDDTRKLHCHLKPYAKIDNETQHFDWLVVKNSID